MTNDNTDEETNVDPNAGGADEVKENMQEEQEKGYRGTVPDATPNEAYTLGGVQRGDSTPENPQEKDDF